MAQFPIDDPLENPINRWISWGLEPVSEAIATFEKPVADVEWEYRLAKMPASYRYTFSDGSKAVDALVISNLVVTLRLKRQPAPKLFFLVTLDHWSSNRSQQPFPSLHFEILNAGGTRLALAGLNASQTFVSDCQATAVPGAPWQSLAVEISGAAKEYFDSAHAVRVVLPAMFGGKPYDHGPICY
ncbi:hypothetical protein [Variovorax sp. ZT4R33]|uniref:hypothetical protein n=1 Tax=Variovorax sp. ZT4R33 TaxID=3443743 RepID=UPI003F4838BC